MMIHDFDLCRFYLNKDKIIQLNSQASSFKRFYKIIKDYEIATVSMKSKNGVLCLINNSRHCSFGYDQRVELFGSKGMLISDNKYENDSKLYISKNTSVKNNFMHFFIDRYKEAYNLQLDDLVKLHKKILNLDLVFLTVMKRLDWRTLQIYLLRKKPLFSYRVIYTYGWNMNYSWN